MPNRLRKGPGLGLGVMTPLRQDAAVAAGVAWAGADTERPATLTTATVTLSDVAMWRETVTDGLQEGHPAAGPIVGHLPSARRARDRGTCPQGPPARGTTGRAWRSAAGRAWQL